MVLCNLMLTFKQTVKPHFPQAVQSVQFGMAHMGSVSSLQEYVSHWDFTITQWVSGLSTAAM